MSNLISHQVVSDYNTSFITFTENKFNDTLLPQIENRKKPRNSKLTNLL